MIKLYYFLNMFYDVLYHLVKFDLKITLVCEDFKKTHCINGIN